MKLLITSFLSLLIVLQSVSVFINIGNELKEVVTDYQLHKTKYGDDFATFWSKHFGKLKEQHKEQHKKDHREHQHKHDNKGINIHQDLGFVDIRFIDDKLEFPAENSQNFYYLEKTLIPSVNKILQPPRQA